MIELYIIISVLLAIYFTFKFCLINSQGNQYQNHYSNYMRKFISTGSWLIAIWMFFAWLAFLVVFSRLSEISFIVALLLTYPGGYSLGVAFYNVIRKILGV